MGVYFCNEPVDKHVRVARLLAFPLIIPPGDSNYVSRASLTVPKDVTVLSVMPHMHLLGREMTVAATSRSKSDSARPFTLAQAFIDAKCRATPESTVSVRSRPFSNAS